MSQTREKKSHRVTISTPSTEPSMMKGDGDNKHPGKQTKKKETEQEEKVTTQKEEPETKEKHQEDEDTSGNLNVLSNLTDEDKVLINEEPPGGIDNGNSVNMPDNGKGKNDETSESVIKNANIDDDINQENNIQNHDTADDNIEQNKPEVNDKIKDDESQRLQEKAKEERITDDTTNENDEKQETHAFITEPQKIVSVDEGATSPVKSEEEKQKRSGDDENSDLSHIVKSNDQKENEDDKSPKLETDAKDDQSELPHTSIDRQKDDSDKQVRKDDSEEQIQKDDSDEQVQKDDSEEQVQKDDSGEQVQKDDSDEQVQKDDSDEQVQKEDSDEQVQKDDSDERVQKDDSNEQVKKDDSDERVSLVGSDEIEKKKKTTTDDIIIHTGQYDDTKYGTKDDGFEEGTMEIDDEVIQHESRERKYSSASSESRSSKKSSKSSHTSKDERLNNSSSDIKENDREKDRLFMDVDIDKNTEKDDSKNSKQHANVIQESQKKEQPEVKTQARDIESKKTEKKPQNVRYMDKGKHNKNDKVSSSTTVSQSRDSDASYRHAYRKTSQSANFRRPEHTSPRGKAETVPRRRPRTTDTRTLPSRGKQKVKLKASKDGNPKGGGTDKQKKNYFHEELRRLKTHLDTKAKSERIPETREYYPYTFTTMGPYCDTHTAQFLICMPDEELQPQRPISRGRSDDKSHGYVSRNTAIGLCDPWVDLRMDKEILPRLVPSKAQLKEKRVAESARIYRRSARTPRRNYTRSAPPRQQGNYEQKKKQKEKEKKSTEGSTRLPKFPVVPFNTQKENATKMFPYSDVKKFRQEYCEKYSTSSPKRMDADYKRTKDDFYRMDLDRLHEIQPNNRKHMRKTYFAYLQNTPGSRKAVTECVRELYNTTEDEENKQKSSVPPTPQHNAQEVN